MGTPDFLKKKYGNGYRLQVQLKGDTNAAYLDDEILKQISNAVKTSDFNGERVVYSIPYEGFSFYQVYSLLD